MTTPYGVADSHGQSHFAGLVRTIPRLNRGSTNEPAKISVVLCTIPSSGPLVGPVAEYRLSRDTGFRGLPGQFRIKRRGEFTQTFPDLRT